MELLYRFVSLRIRKDATHVCYNRGHSRRKQISMMKVVSRNCLPLTFPCTTLSLTFCQSPLLMASNTSTRLLKMFIAAAAAAAANYYGGTGIAAIKHSSSDHRRPSRNTMDNSSFSCGRTQVGCERVGRSAANRRFEIRLKNVCVDLNDGL